MYPSHDSLMIIRLVGQQALLLQHQRQADRYNIENITPEQDRDIFNIIAPILDEYLNTELDIETKVLSWDDLCNGILNLDENEKLSVDDKARITQYLCKDELQ